MSVADHDQPQPRVGVESVGARAQVGLTELEAEILAFESRWWAHEGAKDEGIRERFDMSAARYYQLLNRLIDTEAALATDPLLVKRLRRQRESRRRARSARALGVSLHR